MTDRSFNTTPTPYTPPHLPTENSGECSMCFLPWPCPVAVTWEQAHDVFCPTGRSCEAHLYPGDRYNHVHLIPIPTKDTTHG